MHPFIIKGTVMQNENPLMDDIFRVSNAFGIPTIYA